MNYSFDFFNQPEKPYTVLCNPNKEELCSLGLMFDAKVTLKYNALSQFTFSYLRTVEGTTQPAYDLLDPKRLVLIEGIGYFIIDDVDEITDGLIPVKTVTASSLEMELTYKKLYSFKGVMKFYDVTTPQTSFLYKVLSGSGWSIGTIDASLYNINREFNVSDGTIYSVLMNEAETAYGCVFEFNTFTKTVSAKNISNAIASTDIYLSYDNLIQNSTFSKKSDEIVTALSVYGGGNLDIRAVNPLGGNYIYNFDYFKNTQWMSAGLVTAINNWKALIASRQVYYAGLLANLKAENVILTTKNALLVTKNTEMDVLLVTKKTRIEGKLPLDDINSQIAAKQVEINIVKAAIVTQNLNIASIKLSIAQVNTQLSLTNTSNFTLPQQAELKTYIIENTYQNTNIVVYDNMTPEEIQDWTQILYDYGASVLTKMATPRYEFSLTISNFITLKEYSSFTNQLVLGCGVTVNIRDDYMIENALLEISYSLDNPSDATFKFGNRLRLDGKDFIFSDLFGKTVSTSNSVNFNQSDWSNWTDSYKDEVNSFISSSLDTTKNQLINSSNQEIVINGSGLHGLQLTSATGVEPKTYSPKQFWMTSNTLAFSDDSFATAKLALGAITYNTQPVYGLMADVIVGELLAGSQLNIRNENNNFVLDSTGATLNNASFTIQNLKTKILIDPTNGIKIQKNLNTTSVVVGVNSTVTAVRSGLPKGTPLTLNYTISSNPNRILIVEVSSSGEIPTLVTYGSKSMIRLASSLNPNGNKPNSSMWYLLNPTSGVNTISVKFNVVTYVEIGATEYYNVNQKSPFGTVYTSYGNASGFTASVPADPNSLSITTIGYWNNGGSATSTETIRWNVTSDGAWKGAGNRKYGSSDGSYQYLYWSFGSAKDYSVIGVSLNVLDPSPRWDDTFYVSIDGNLTFKGNLSGASGTFSGDLTGATGTFSGEISASSGNIGGWKIDANGLSNPSNPSTIYFKSSATTPEASIGIGGYGVGVVKYMTGPTSYVYRTEFGYQGSTFEVYTFGGGSENTISMYSDFKIALGAPTLNLNGRISVNDVLTVASGTWYFGSRRVTINNGLITEII